MKIRFLAAMVALLATATGHAADGVRLQWFGQAAFKLTAPGGEVIVIDPFIRNNPVLPEAHRDLEGLGSVDLILVTHAHGDHWGDTPDLARRTGAGRAERGFRPDRTQARRHPGRPGDPLQQEWPHSAHR